MTQKNITANRWPLVAGLVALVVIIGAIGILLRNLPTNSTLSVGTETAAEPSETPNADATQTQEALATILAFKQSVATTAAAYPPVTPIIDPTGIYDNEMVKAGGGKLGLAVQNAWFGIVNGNLVWIYAGAYGSDPDQGIAQVLITFPYRNFDQSFPTTEKRGALRVVSEQNNRLTLVSADGSTFYFDVPGLTYVSSPTEIVPTASPPPTYTPFAPAASPAPTGYPLPLDTPLASTTPTTP